MKIKTITCHQVYNYGASLQEMALVEFLNLHGHDAKSIAYCPDYLSANHKLFSCVNPRWNKNIFFKISYIALKLPGRLKLLIRKKRFNEFDNKYIPTTSEVFLNNEQLKKIKDSADVFICGSDQIWNPIFPNGRDPAFYLDFAKESKAIKMSYAASFATDNIPQDNIEFVKKSVAKLDIISVRETSGKKILNDLGFEKVEQVLDPVFLLSQQHWLGYIDSQLVNEKYILIYDFDNNKAIKEVAQKIAKKHGLLIIGINKNLKYVDKNYYLYGPAEFIDLVNNAELVLTTSFHALAFGLIFKRRLGVFNRNVAINTRMRDLLKLLDLSGNLFDSVSDLTLSDFDIDYDIVDKKIFKHVKRSQQFLIDSISSINQPLTHEK